MHENVPAASVDRRTSQGAWTDLALHTLGWKAFQDLCAHVCEDVLEVPVEVYREAQDGGQDAVFRSKVGSSGQQEAISVVQCKFSSNAGRNLRAGDVEAELAKLAELKEDGNIDRYIFMTSMSCSGRQALKVKEKVREAGIRRCSVFGKEFLVRVIRSSSKLRALVPRIYGLGDLSTILDERQALQTKALLGHMASSLQAYVPTQPHVAAVRALSKHKLVLLVGDPASGKSTIAAVLSTIAADDPRHVCYKADGPKKLLENWNPDQPGGFYWIDDAFGPNQLREDYVDDWIALMSKLQAAIAAGNSFVLTSRRHIYEAARPKLGTRNHPLFRDRTAIVEVGALSEEERHQILYNHIKFGSQNKTWKKSAKLFLKYLAREPTFTPEVARQIGNPGYTNNVVSTLDSLTKFIRQNREFLLQTIAELSKMHRAALTLVFLHRGKMPVGEPIPEIMELVTRFYDVSRGSLAESLSELRETFLVEVAEGNRRSWSFKHPTLSDALAESLREAEGMRELYLRGVGVETILSEVLCDGMEEIRNAVMIPQSLNNLIINRLMEVPDDGGHINRLFFHFLWTRASDEVFRGLLKENVAILTRKSWASRELAFDPKVNVYARAFKCGLLTDELRFSMAERIHSDLIIEDDVSFIDREDILALLSPRQIIKIERTIQTVVMPSLYVKAENTGSNSDEELSPEENFEEVQASIEYLKTYYEDDNERLSDVEGLSLVVRNEIDELISKREEAERERDEDDWRWQEIASQRPMASRSSSPSYIKVNSIEPRSIFSDVDD